MKIPNYIKKHIETNNKLLRNADKHAEIVIEWYNKQLEKLNADESEIPTEEFSEIQMNWIGNGEFDLFAIKENLELLEEEMETQWHTK